MLFKPELLKLVLEGKKTQTRRLLKDSHGYINADDLGFYRKVNITTQKDFIEHGFPHQKFITRTLWEVGNDYAVQPGRGKKSEGRIRIMYIRKQDVRHIKSKDILAEGFQTSLEFLWTWCGMHDKPALDELSQTEQDSLVPFHIPLWIWDRPAEFYNAWVLEFERVDNAS